MTKFGILAFALLGTVFSGSAFAAGFKDAKIVCSTAQDFQHAHVGINISAASYARAGYRLSSPVIRHDDKKQTTICITAAKN
jgi:hypothetical protein